MDAALDLIAVGAFVSALVLYVSAFVVAVVQVVRSPISLVAQAMWIVVLFALPAIGFAAWFATGDRTKAVDDRARSYLVALRAQGARSS